PVAELETPTPLDPEREPSAPPAVAEATMAKAHAAFPLRDEATVGTLELHFRWSDGTPAAGVNARIMPWRAQDAFLLVRSVQTDSFGVGLVDQLAPGIVGVYPDRCSGGTAEIVAGQTVIHEVRIPVGVTFYGRVLDPAGRVVAGATICLSAGGNHHEGFPVATADPGGWYEVRGVIGLSYLSARAPGHGPSEQVFATGPGGSEIELDLVLRGASGTLSGVVLAPDGLPFAGARIRIEGHAPEGWQPSQVGRRSFGEPLPFALVTDGAGRFRVEQVGAGPLVVQVRAEGWAPWKGTVVVPAGSSEQLDIVLAEGAVLEGIVTHSDGSPAEDAYVSHGHYGGFGSTRVRADSKGAYRVTGLPAGSLELTASMHERGEASTTMVLALGATARWDATLYEGLTLRGTVVDESDQPLARWLVGTTNGRGISSYLAWTGPDGRFVLRDIEAGATALVVGPADVAQTGPCLVLPEALHTQGDLRLVVPDAVRPSASARLRVLVDGEPAPRSTQVIAGGRELYPDAEGLVAITRLTPGKHKLTVMMPDRVRRSLQFEVSAGERLDLGELDLTVGGRVRLELAGEGARGALRAIVLDASGSRASAFDVEEGLGLSHLLPAGPVNLRIVGTGVAAQVIEGTVADGETVVMRAVLRPGTSRWIVARTTDGTRFPRATVSVFHSAGELVLKQIFVPATGDFAPEARIQLLGLEPGAYRVVLTCSDSRSGEGVLTVATLEEDGEVAARIAVE
ncbi:MAG: carboxypeptidase-like regulatory domain-containing protein, partial [Planctomycetota bacterium]